ncbi:MAG: DUF2330 domain-containing protein, partial [archaeon]
MKKLISIFLLCLFLLPLVLADGMIIRPNDYVMERGQLAYINYKEDSKLQTMVLGIQLDSIHDQDAAWIFPVPSSASNVAIDVLPNTPHYYGREVKSYASSVIDNLLESVVAFQVWPMFFLFRFVAVGAPMYGLAEKAAAGMDIETGQSVVVYEHIEKYGITTELLGAEDPRYIKTYLTNKGLDVPFEAYRVLESYKDKDYTFVVSWLNEPQNIYYGIEEEASIERSPPYYPQYRNVGVQVMFKTDKPYYPLLPTSVYGSEKVPATIYIDGYVTPVVPEGVKPFTKTTYMKTSAVRYPEPMYDKMMYPATQTPNEYTVVSIIDAPSKFFTDDMWFEDSAPSDVYYASSLVNNFDLNRGVKALVVVALLSILLGALLGFIIFREQWWKITLISLANCLSIIGLIVALFFVRTRKVDSSLKKQMKQAGLVT